MQPAKRQDHRLELLLLLHSPVGGAVLHASCSNGINVHKTAHQHRRRQALHVAGGTESHVRLPAGAAGARAWLGSMAILCELGLQRIASKLDVTATSSAVCRNFTALLLPQPALMEMGMLCSGTRRMRARVVECCQAFGVNTSPMHRHYEVSVRSRGYFRYRQITVGQGVGCADLVRQVIALLQPKPDPGQPIQRSLRRFTAPDSPHRRRVVALSDGRR
jgi:hypothetical protein